VNPHLILSVGTQVVALVEVKGPDGKAAHPRGAVGVVVQAPGDYWHSYRVRFPDGFEAALKRQELSVLSQYKREQIGQGGVTTSGAATSGPLAEYSLFDHVIYRCVVGSRAYGLDDADSDTDRRGVYLPPAELHWSLYGVPEQLENAETEETYWELQKFLTLALKANPNVLECLYTPIVEHATPLARELLAMRESFLSRMVYQTYNGYVLSQFKKLQADLRNKGAVKWKHVMHLVRLLLAGITTLREGVVPVHVGPHRAELLAIKRGELPLEEVEKWRLDLHQQFDAAAEATRLPERPDYERANAFLIRARRSMVSTSQ
jgi:predicted nucleotidyltransferase